MFMAEVLTDTNYPYGGSYLYNDRVRYFGSGNGEGRDI